MTHQFQAGFQSLYQEYVGELLVSGKIPEWLSGRLLRNGPVQFDVGAEHYNHWFDGLAMLHQFSFQQGHVHYQNRFLRSKAYEQGVQMNRIVYPEFATNPKWNPFQTVIKGLFPMPFGGNANVNISRIGGEWVALTETPMPVVFNPDTLETLQTLSYQDHLKGQHCTAHPHYDWNRKLLTNSITCFGPKSYYHVYTMQDGSLERRLLASIPVSEPGYIHSFGITERYVVLVEFPLVAKPLSLLLSGQPFIQNFKWKPRQGARFFVVDRNTGELHRVYETEALFAFHHVNAFEQGQQLCVDIASNPDNDLLNAFYLNRARTSTQLPSPRLVRFRLDLISTKITREYLSDEIIELPRIHYKALNTKPYKIVYGISVNAQQPDGFANQLCKVNVQTGQSKTWYVEDCYPGEPILIPAPSSTVEDEGVIASVVLDGKRGHSFLLILDAQSFGELGRAALPFAIPFGFHGIYLEP